MSDFNGNNTPSEPTIPSIDKPEFEVPPQPEQFGQPEFIQTEFQQPINLTNGLQSKKSKKKFVAIIAAIIGVLACVCVAVFAGPKIMDAISKTSKKEPIDRLKSTFQSMAKELSETKEKYDSFEYKNCNTTAKINLSLSDTVVSMLPESIANLKDTTIDMNVTNYEKQNYCFFVDNSCCIVFGSLW